MNEAVLSLSCHSGEFPPDLECRHHAPKHLVGADPGILAHAKLDQHSGQSHHHQHDHIGDQETGAWRKFIQRLKTCTNTFKQSHQPPFSKQTYGNLQTLPRPTASPSEVRKNSQ